MSAIFWCSLVVLLTAALAGLVRPFIRHPALSIAPTPDLAVYRRQQAEIAADVANGLLSNAEADEARTEIARRALRLEAQGTAPVPVQPTRLARRGATLALVLVVPISTISIYLALGRPTAIERGATVAEQTASPHTSGELAVSATRLTERLAQDPKDANGWVLLGRTLAALDRYPEAADAFAKAIALVPDEPSLHAQRGEVLALGADGTVTDAAFAEFQQAGDDPRARFYLAGRAAQAGDTATAIAQLQKLLADAPADANWRSMVVDALDELGVHDAAAPSPVRPAPAEPTPRGPTADQMTAAAQMAPTDRQSMIRGMVDGLAARLEADPSDLAGWTRLAQAYEVLGDKDKAAAARARAAGAAVATDPTPVSAPASAKPPEGNPLAAKAQALAAHLSIQPDDRAGWLDLVRTDRGLGREADAMAALKQANQKNPGALDLLVAYADGLSQGIDGEKLPTEFIQVMTQINALDGDQPDALWYLGLAAKQRGDVHRARTYWTRLAARLSDGDERVSVRRSLAKLP